MASHHHIGPRYGSVRLIQNRDAAELVVSLSDRGYTAAYIAQKLQDKFKLARPPARWTIARVLRRWGVLIDGRWRMQNAKTV